MHLLVHINIIFNKFNNHNKQQPEDDKFRKSSDEFAVLQLTFN